MKGQLFRVAHLGFFDPLDTLAVIGALEQVTADTLKVSGFNWATALAAAQQVLSARTKRIG